MSSQEKIWDYFQNVDTHFFDLSKGRLRYLVKMIPYGKRVLNIGVGTGYFEMYALEAGLDVHSLDPNEESIKNLQRRITIGEKAKAGVAQQIPWSSDYFDYVVMSEVLEHLEDRELFDSVREIERVLRPGGGFIGTVPYREDLADSMVVCPKCAATFHRWGHVRSFTESEITKLLSANFLVRSLRRRYFPSQARLTLIGRMQEVLRSIFTLAGLHVANQRLLFEAVKRPAAAPNS